MHTIEHATLLAAGEKIDVEHLPAVVRGDQRRDAVPASAQMAPLGAASREFERDYLVRVLSACDGKRIRAAESLGISRKNLWEKIRLHAISDLDQDAHTA